MSASSALVTEWPAGARSLRDGRRTNLKRASADASYAALRLSGWLITTTLASMGVFMLFFLMIGDFTPLGFFSQLGNLGTRFVAADELRRSSFMGQVDVVAAVIFALVTVARWRLLLTILVPRKGDRHG
jgi:hypothetical protein